MKRDVCLIGYWKVESGLTGLLRLSELGYFSRTGNSAIVLHVQLL